MPSNNFQLPLINSHWKMLPFMTSFPHSEKVNNILRNAFHLPPYHCLLWSADLSGALGHKGWTLNLMLLLCAAPRSNSVRIPQLCSTYQRYQCVQQSPRAPQPTGKIQLKQFS